jgi:hypothetical protein
MLTRLTVTLKTTERDALRILALQERRDTGDQAAIIIRSELERLGLLEPDVDFFCLDQVENQEANNVESSRS